MHIHLNFTVEMKTISRLFYYVLLPLAIAAGGAVWVIHQWVYQPLTLPKDTVDVLIPQGTSPAGVAHVLNQAGIDIDPRGFVWLARLSDLDKKLKAGGYQVKQGDSVWDVIRRMAAGEVTQRQVTLVEGWTLRQIRQALRQHPDIRQTLTELTEAQILEKLGLQSKYAEGLFFPDTYVFPVGTTDLEILQQSLLAQQQLLDKMWQTRQPGLPLKSPYEALILASIVEKETGLHADRGKVAGVFVNRLRIGMPLQTDPTVIYGMGESYQGKIRKKDLQTDTPWNTYTRTGLPPSPIASAGKASLEAALNPEKHNYLYFVARGDGSSAFAVSLPDHNKNVSQYILGRKP